MTWSPEDPFAEQPSVRLESTLPFTGSNLEPTDPNPTTIGGSRDDDVVAYELLNDGRGYDFVFRGHEKIIDRHMDEFACMAASARFISGRESPSLAPSATL